LQRWKLVLLLLPLLSSPPDALAQDPAAAAADRCPEPERILSPGCRTLELSGICFVEVWDFNGRSKPDVLAGGSAAVSFTLVDGLGAVIEVLGVRVAEQLRDIDLVRPSASFLGGASGLLRKRIGTHDGMTFFAEGGLGVSDATAQVPEGGTRFNYLLQAGGGLSRRLGQRMAFIVNLRLFHLSNNGLRGAHRNPDIEALGAHVGVLVGF
jgi:hypothetical protein